MHNLIRICIQNWYLIDARDIDIVEATALVGPTGAGKSSIQDAVQTIITGGNQNRLNLNASASGRSGRSVFEYCLGLTKDPAEGGKPIRSSCETVLALVFRDEETLEPITVGIAMSAREGDSREEVLSRFIVPGYAYSVNDFKRRNGSRETLAPWTEIIGAIKKNHPTVEEYRTSAEKFTADMLKIMSGGQSINVKHFLRAFSNALAFKPIFDPTVFVRDYILEPDFLDVERVKTSIETWQELERIIQEVTDRLKRVDQLSERFRNWGRARMRSEAARFTSCMAETRRNAHDVAAYRELFKRKTTDLNAERNILSTRRQWVKELDADIRAKRALTQAGDDASRLAQIEAAAQLAERDLKDANDRFRKIREALASISQLNPIIEYMTPSQAHALEAAKTGFKMMPEGIDPAAAMKGRGESIQGLVDQVTGIEGLDSLIHEKADQLSEELRDLQSRSEQLEQMLNRSGGGAAILSHPTTKLLSELSRKQMNPIPLCDVIEVIDESWQYAIEAMLGRGREAVIVPPERLQEAHDFMERDKDLYSSCTLVRTTWSHKVDLSISPGSILEAIQTDDTHAAAFLTSRLGSVLKADTVEDLERLRRGVMRNGKTSSEMVLSVQRNLRELILGRSAREKTGETLRNELAPLKERLAKLRLATRLLREAGRLIPQAIDTLKNGEGPYYLEHTLVAAHKKLEGLHENKQAVASKDIRDLISEIDDMERDRDLYNKEISEEIEPNVERLQGEVASARAKLEYAQEHLKTAIKQKKKAWETLSSKEVEKIPSLDPEVDEPNARGVVRRIRADISRGEAERKDAKAWLASFRNDNKAIADSSEGEVRREQAGAIRGLAEYSANWDAEVPQIDADTMTIGYAWVIGEQSRLANNELLRHQEACARAADEMRRMLKEDLLARLAEKLNKVHHRMETLNLILSKRKFTGQTYSFTSSVNQQFGRMHDLAMKIGNQGDEPLGLDDAEISDAVTELEGMIDGAEDAKKLADYREYFNFEIIMTDAAGGRTSMSSRAVKGSGGEAQAPFYVAIAASLASAYFPGFNGVGKPKGMGLALFDEAFNKLDVPNTQALLNFFKDMGLQLMIAGPEDKRATFTEVLDTIVLVNKSLDATSVYVDAEYPGLMARQSLGDINPDHKGVEAYRAVPA